MAVFSANLFRLFFRFRRVELSKGGLSHHPKLYGLKYKFGVWWKDSRTFDHGAFDLMFRERGGGIVCQGKKWKNSAILVGIGDHMHHSPGYVRYPDHQSPMYFTRVTHFLPWIKKVLVIYFKS